MIAGLLLVVSCNNGSVDHINSSTLVIVQKIPVVEKKIDENFKAALHLLYPVQCHDTAFIQDQIFLERIDLKVPFKREFVIAPKLWRDFFGSNNPDAKKSLRENLLYLGDTCFEKNPDRPFLTESMIRGEDQPKVIGDYLSRNGKNALVYLISADTAMKTYEINGSAREVFGDFAKLNCKIVSLLRGKTREELNNTSLILVLIPPPGTVDTATGSLQDSIRMVKKGKKLPAIKTAVIPVKNTSCPPDSVVNRINKQNNLIINEFRNLLHYIATTNDDELKKWYRQDADEELHKIPGLKIEGIPGHLPEFLNSGFPKNVKVAPILNNCRVIIGVRIGES